MFAPEELTSNKVYQKLAETYGLAFDSTYTQFLKFHLLERFSKPDDVCLDVGIANGIFSIPFSEKVREIHGVDISEEMLRECESNIARFHIQNIRLYQRSATDLKFGDSFFDTAFSYSTLLLVPDMLKALYEIARVLKPAGLAILDIPGKRNLSQVYWNKYYVQEGHWGIHAFDLGDIKGILRRCGFSIVEIHPTGFSDQWKYTKLSGKVTFLEKVFHSRNRAPDLDYLLSRIVPWLANRWYFVLQLDK